MQLEPISSVLNDNTSGWYSERCEKAIEYLSVHGGDFTAEDIRELAGDPPNHWNALGGLISGAVQAGLIKRVGYTKATRKSSHSRTLAVYRGTRLQDQGLP